VRRLAARGYFHLCLGVGRLLRSGRYATTRIVRREGVRGVRKRRDVHAPLFVALGGPLHRLLDTGVRLLVQREWEARERQLHHALRDDGIEVERDGTLVLPCLPGTTLAALLEDPSLGARGRRRAIGLAVAALADFHSSGLTHGDAMAENVLVDLESDQAHWFDFETVHDPGRPMAWRRADDLRALLATCACRLADEQLPETIDLMLTVYADEEIARLVTDRFASPLVRPLAFHLGQAPLSYRRFREIARLLTERTRPA
jgi:hypothetical protein